MRIPIGFEDMIKEIVQAAGKHGFYLRHDELTDYPPNPLLTNVGHTFEYCIHLARQQKDFQEDALILSQLASGQEGTCIPS
jgi:hypothetical protein